MSSQTINYTKIIILIVIVGGFIAGLFLLKNTLNKSCSYGEVYDNKLGCIKDCSPFPNMRYDSEKKDCVPNCLENQVFCGTTCINNNQKCLGPNIICDNNDNIDFCGQNCYDKNKQQCIGDKIYDNNKVCNSFSDPPILCKDNEQCSQDNTQCITCDQPLCKGDICCKKGEHCNKDGICTPCTDNETPCGSTCCGSGYKCDGKGNCVRCDHDLCGSKCCDNVSGCINNTECCDPTKIYKINDTLSGCCKEGLSDDGKCCSLDNQTLVNGKCMIKCGDQIFCDPGTQFCGETIGDKNKFYCATRGCEWDSLTYNPPNLSDPNNPANSIPVFYGNNNKLYISQQAFPLSRSVYDTESVNSIKPCQNNDCIGRLVENGLQNVQFDTIRKTCNGDFVPSILPTSISSCPLSPSQCCKDSLNNFTGQVCKDGQSCYYKDGVNFCTSCVDTNCNGYGKCSMTVENKCECDHGYDPSNNCSKCLSGQQIKTVNGYNYCVNSTYIQTWTNDGYTSSWFVLSTNARRYIISAEGSDSAFNFTNSLIDDNIKYIIFEPTGNPDILSNIRSIDIRGFNNNSSYYSFKSTSIMTKDQYYEFLTGRQNSYYVDIIMEQYSPKININVYFS